MRHQLEEEKGEGQKISESNERKESEAGGRDNEGEGHGASWRDAPRMGSAGAGGKEVEQKAGDKIGPYNLFARLASHCEQLALRPTSQRAKGSLKKRASKRNKQTLEIVFFLPSRSLGSILGFNLHPGNFRHLHSRSHEKLIVLKTGRIVL